MIKKFLKPTFVSCGEWQRGGKGRPLLSLKNLRPYFWTNDNNLTKLPNCEKNNFSDLVR